MFIIILSQLTILSGYIVKLVQYRLCARTMYSLTADFNIFSDKRVYQILPKGWWVKYSDIFFDPSVLVTGKLL